jgi:hypothetical protein
MMRASLYSWGHTVPSLTISLLLAFIRTAIGVSANFSNACTAIGLSLSRNTAQLALSELKADPKATKTLLYYEEQVSVRYSNFQMVQFISHPAAELVPRQRPFRPPDSSSQPEHVCVSVKRGLGQMRHRCYKTSVIVAARRPTLPIRQSSGS